MTPTPDPERNRLLSAALLYAARGWAVFPVHTWRESECSCGDRECEHPAKHPWTRHGLKDATTDRERIRGWWARNPDANVAIATGAVSGIIVIDVDPRHGGDTSLQDWGRSYGPMPPTVESETGGGGRHLLFRHPGYKVGNRINVVTGIDVRGDGGYIVAPPSLHPSGRRYRWAR